MFHRSRSLSVFSLVMCAILAGAMAPFVGGVIQAQSPAPYVLYGLDFSPYIAGQNPNFNPQVSAAQIQARMQIVAAHTRWIRSFSMTNGLENVPSIARSFGLKVAAGAWISSNVTTNAAEIANLIAACNAGLVDLAIVGSEALLRNDVTETQLIAYT